jgi:hypothetical protein
MNCQEFRKAWAYEPDIETLSHIETCDECIAWMEAQLTSGEEVQFLKEVPQPMADLEEKIMHAIYQTAGQSAPPHAASASVTPSPKQAKFRRWTSYLPSLSWVGAAAILLAVGVAGYQQFQLAGQDGATENAMHHESKADMEQKDRQIADAPSILLSPDTPVASPAAGYGYPDIAAKQPDGQTSPDGTTVQPAALAMNDSGTNQPKSAASQAQEPHAGSGAKTAEKAQPPQTSRTQAFDTVNESGQPLHKRTIIAARNANGKSANDHVKHEDTPSKQTDAIKPTDGQSAIQKTENEWGVNMFSNDAAPDPSIESVPPVAGPPATDQAKQEITLSAFTDLETAIRSSDVPVPVLNQPPDGMTLQAVTVQYESPTSHKVVRLSCHYQRSKEWIKVDVVPNAKGKRSLSIPGTFTATQLYTVNGEQAIAVSFDLPDSSGEAAAEHAVHFNAQTENQSLYVVMTARGIRLAQLVEMSKQLTWK